jgi:hypothetical protein
MIGALYACAPAQRETASTDTTAVESDTVAIADNAENNSEVIEDADMYDADPGEVSETEDGRLVGDTYEMFGQSYLIQNPFSFSLDSTSLMNLLGEDTEITSQSTPAGEDELGPYDGYTYYTVRSGETELNFYTYSGKHYGDIYTPLLEITYGIKVGMTKEEFLGSFSFPDEAKKATRYTINDDYGTMSFFFEDEKLVRIYVNYEEGD